MALFYKAVKSTMATKSGDKKWHLNLVKVGKVVSTQQLAEMIAEKSSLTPGDVHNVVRNLMTAMRSALLDSKTVRLDGLGTFTMKARTRGRSGQRGRGEPESGGSPSLSFTPEYTRPAAIGTTRALFQGVEFQKASGIGASGNNGSGGGDGDIVDDPTA